MSGKFQLDVLHKLDMPERLGDGAQPGSVRRPPGDDGGQDRGRGQSHVQESPHLRTGGRLAGM